MNLFPYQNPSDDKSLRFPNKKDLWIEILEVYPGTKYTDTYINNIEWS